MIYTARTFYLQDAVAPGARLDGVCFPKTYTIFSALLDRLNIIPFHHNTDSKNNNSK